MPFHSEKAEPAVAAEVDGITSLLAPKRICMTGAPGFATKLATAEAAASLLWCRELAGPRGGGGRRAAASAIIPDFHGSYHT